MADVLTEELRYESQIAIDGEITMTPYKVILKNGVPYITQAQTSLSFSPGDNPSALPAYGPELAKAVWTAAVVTEYQVCNPPEEEVDEPLDEPEDPTEEDDEEEAT